MEKVLLKRHNAKNILFKYGVYFVLLLLIIILSLLTDTFFTGRNALNVLRQISMNSILAFGMTFVIVSDGIDLSVASTVALAGVLASDLAHPGQGFPLILPIIVAIGIGAVVGVINGLIISRTGVPAFIVTLGLQQIARGISYIYTDGRSIIDVSDTYQYIGQGDFLGIPFPIYLLIGMLILSYILLQRTKFGRYVYAVGGNSMAAKVSGIKVAKVRTIVYIISGICAGIVGLILSSRTGSGAPNAGMSYELDAIAATVIGGTSMSGGKGTILGTLVGALIIGILNNGLDLINVSSYVQQVVKGVIIIGAVLIDRAHENKK